MEDHNPFNAEDGKLQNAEIEKLRRETSARLRLAMKVMEIGSTDELGALFGVGGAAVRNWMNAYNFPPVEHMAALCARSGFTLDWIYLGETGGLTVATARKLAEIEARQA